MCVVIPCCSYLFPLFGLKWASGSVACNVQQQSCRQARTPGKNPLLPYWGGAEHKQCHLLAPPTPESSCRSQSARMVSQPSYLVSFFHLLCKSWSIKSQLSLRRNCSIHSYIFQCAHEKGASLVSSYVTTILDLMKKHL